MDLGYYSKLENDKLAYPPSRETIDKIAKALECTPAEKNELLAAAGRIDQEIEGYAHLALKQPTFRKLFKAVSMFDPELLEELLNDIDPKHSIERQKGVEILSIHAPPPSKYISYQVLEEIALQCVFVYRKETSQKKTKQIHADKLIETFSIHLKWDIVEEPEDTIFFASYSQHGNEGEITVNKKHRSFFHSRPDVYNATLGHEIGHCILNHHTWGITTGTPYLFDAIDFTPRGFHKSTWFPYGLSHTEVERLKTLERKVKEKLAKKAAIDQTSREYLDRFRNWHEPEWMFRQAEHFSRCLLIPRDRIIELLQEAWDFSSWSTIYRAAEMFNVPPSMMRLRLEKMGVIEIGEDGKPHFTDKFKQKSLF